MKNIKIHFSYLTIVFLFISFLAGYIKNALIIMGIILFHEIGHIIIIKIFKFNIIKVDIYPFGGITKIDKPLNTKICIDIFIAIGGILAQFLLSFFISSPVIIKYNYSIMFFNLLPVIPLDGSKILLEIYHLFLSFKKAFKLYLITSLLAIVIYIFINYHYNINNYLIISLFVSKTYTYYKMRKIYYHKFILERLLYDLNYSFIDNKNILPSDYQKDHKYYYLVKNGLISQEEYLKKHYRIDNKL